MTLITRGVTILAGIAVIYALFFVNKYIVTKYWTPVVEEMDLDDDEE